MGSISIVDVCVSVCVDRHVEPFIRHIGSNLLSSTAIENNAKQAAVLTENPL